MADRNGEAIAALTASIAACRVCRDAPQRSRRPLPHEPRPVCVASATAPVAICGQAPGTRVHASGRPFTDPSGDRLREWLGVGEATFYDPACLAIVPMGFCFPGLDAKGSDLPPRPECRTLWHDRLFAAMPQLRLVVTIGRYARDYHLPHRRGERLTDTVADWRAVMDESEAAGCAVLVLPHPSWRNSGWLKRHPWFERELLPVLRSRVRRELAGSR